MGIKYCYFNIKGQILVFVLLFLARPAVWAQAPMPDSLRQKFAQLKEKQILDSLISRATTLETQNPQQSLFYLEIAKTYLDEKSEISLHFRWYLLQGNLKNALGESEEALSYLNQALKIAKKQNSLVSQADVMSRLALVYNHQGEYNRAIALQRRVLEIEKKLDNIEKVARAHNNLGISFEYLSDYQQALKHYLEVKRICQETDNKRGLAYSLNNIGNVYAYLGQHEQALGFFKQSLRYKIGLKDPLSLALTYNNIGDVYYHRKLYSEALEYHFKSLKIRNEQRDLDGKISSWHNIGKVYTQTKRFDNAERYFYDALSLSREIKAKRHEIEVMISLASFFLAQDNGKEAKRYALRSLKTAEKEQLAELSRDALEVLSQIARKENDFEQAFAYYQRFIARRDSLNSKQNIKQITEIQARFENEKRLNENERLKSEKVLLQQRQKLQEFFIYSLILIILLAAILLWFFYSRARFRNFLSQKLHKEVKKRTQTLEKTTITLEKSISEVERTNQELDTFLQQIAGDLGSPIATLEGLINVMQIEHREAPSLSAYLQMQRELTAQMKLLLFRIVELVEIRNHEPQFVTVNFNRFMRRMVRSMNRVEGSKSVEFVTDIPQDTNIKADPDMLDIATDNLIKNAIQHNISHTTNYQITIRANEELNTWKIYISDNANGVPQELFDHVFDVFYRRSIRSEGLSLGLYKVRVAINKLQGDIQFVRENEEKTTFIISLPKEPKLDNNNKLE